MGEQEETERRIDGEGVIIEINALPSELSDKRGRGERGLGGILISVVTPFPFTSLLSCSALSLCFFFTIFDFFIFISSSFARSSSCPISLTLFSRLLSIHSRPCFIVLPFLPLLVVFLHKTDRRLAKQGKYGWMAKMHQQVTEGISADKIYGWNNEIGQQQVNRPSRELELEQEMNGWKDKTNEQSG